MNFNATIIGQAISFILFVLFCMKYVWPPIMIVIEKRQQEISNSLILVEHAKKDLNLAKIKADNYLKTAKKEAKTIIEKANKYQDETIHTVKIIAEKERKKILEQAKFEISHEYQIAYENLRKQVSFLVITCTEKIIEQSINKNNNNIIVNKIIDKL
ncbi:ATP synthase subunit b [Serratia symbiotica]|nr:ATP synthase subunit b [Serratia symbiotica]